MNTCSEMDELGSGWKTKKSKLTQGLYVERVIHGRRYWHQFRLSRVERWVKRKKKTLAYLVQTEWFLQDHIIIQIACDEYL
jgi:hypothetical protein